MNCLWVYGCSFSEPFGILSGCDWDSHGFRNLHGIDYWGTHLAKKLKFKCNTISISGIGWNYINDLIDRDFGKWKKDDIIIISPSFFTRTTIREFKEYNNASSWKELHDRWILLQDIHKLNETRWVNKIKSLQKNYQVYTWAVEDILYHDINDIDNLIKAEKYSNWKNWMNVNKQFWIDPTTNVYPLGDWHFNLMGHIHVAELMYENIKK